MKHTPGPWQINQFNSSQVCDSDGEGRGCAPIAFAWGTESEQRANSRLIAAAPDLLEIAERWAALDGGAWNTARYDNEKSELMADTHAAIEKATGGKS